MFTIHNFTRLALSAALATGLTAAAKAEDSDIQKQLSNPIASLTLLPIQVNYDARIGPERDGHRITTNIQPVIGQNEIFPGAGEQFGLGDTAWRPKD